MTEQWELIAILDRTDEAIFKRPRIEAEIPETDNIPHHCRAWGWRVGFPEKPN